MKFRLFPKIIKLFFEANALFERDLLYLPHKLHDITYE